MNDRLQALLAAERAAAADVAGVDDAAFAERVVSTLRGVAVAGTAAAVTTSTSASATVATTTKGMLGGVGIAKVVGIIGVVAAVGVGSVVVVQGAAPRAAPAIAVEQRVDVVDDTVVDDAVRDDAVDAVATVPVQSAVPAAAPPRRARAPIVVEAAPVVTPAVAPSTSPSELARYDEASTALRAGRVEEAAALFAALLMEHPSGVLRPETQVSLVESLYRAGRFEQVVVAARDAVGDVDGARRADVRRLEAEALVKLGRCGEARAAWDEALAGHARQLTADDVTAAVAACATR